MSTLIPLEKVLRTPMHDRAFSLSFFRYFRAVTHYKLFVSFCSLDFGCKINRIKPLLAIYFIKITGNNTCYTQITMGIADYSKPQLKLQGSQFEEY